MADAQQESDSQPRPYALLGLYVKGARERAGLTQEELARRIYTSTSYVGHIERGARRPEPPVLQRIADTLLIDEEELEILAGYKRPPAATTLEIRGRGPLAGAFRRMARIHDAERIVLAFEQMLRIWLYDRPVPPGDTEAEEDTEAEGSAEAE